jgi:hypothetical protein
MKRLLERLVVVLPLCVFASPARAAEPIELRIDNDVPVVSNAGVRHIVELELHTTVSVDNPALTTRVHVSHPAAGPLARIDVDDGVTNKTSSRTVDLQAMGEKGSTRLLAMAIVELVSASWSELETNPKPEAVAVGPQAPADVRRDVRTSLRERRAAWHEIAVIGTAQGPFHNIGPLFGGGLRYVPTLSGHIALPVDVTYAHGSNAASTGSVGIDVVSVDASLAWQIAWQPFGVRAGLGARGGAVRYDGQARNITITEGRTVWAPYVTPLATLSILGFLGSTFTAELIVEGGYASTPTKARVSGADDMSLSGAWVGGAVALGARVVP